MKYMVTYSKWVLENGNDWVDDHSFYSTFDYRHQAEAFIENVLKVNKHVFDIRLETVRENLDDLWDMVND